MKWYIVLLACFFWLDVVLSFPTKALIPGDYACLDQQIGDEKCSFYKTLYDINEAELFCSHWQRHCCLSCIEMKLDLDRKLVLDKKSAT